MGSLSFTKVPRREKQHSQGPKKKSWNKGILSFGLMCLEDSGIGHVQRKTGKTSEGRRIKGMITPLESAGEP